MNFSTRRDFLRSSFAAGAAIGTGVLPGFAIASPARRAEGLRILVLGGTNFIGPALVEIARQRGHSITVFNRGITEKRKGHLGDDIERLVGDRDPDKGAGIAALKDKKWDVCIDDSGFYPRHVKASAETLAPNIRQYIFVSSISAYADNSKPNQDEDAPLATLDDPTVEDMGDQFQNYGGLKVLCEQAAETALPGRTTIVRPGFIVGPGDPTDRFTYWPVRVQRGGEMLAPGTPDDPIQVIDVRDLAAFLLTLAENNTIGAFNACGPGDPLTMGKLLSESKRACEAMESAEPVSFTWVSAKFIHDHPEPIDTTIWIAPEGEAAGFHRWSNARAVKAGLTFHPIVETARDTLEWWPKEVERRVRVTSEMMEEAKTKGEPPPEMADPTKLRAGIPSEQEQRLLAAWHAAQAAGDAQGDSAPGG